MEAMHTAGLTPLVGREHELGLLLDRWERAKEGEGQVVLLSGEPEVGKSRLIRALCERLGDGAYTPLSWLLALPPDDRAPPVVALLERAAGFARGDPPGRRLASSRPCSARPPTRSRGRRRCSLPCWLSRRASATRWWR